MVEKVAYNKSLWPTERKPKPKNLTANELGFSYTPNGSFYDMDEEYFNKQGFDIHGGWYTKEKEYIYGPDWLSDLGCYEDEKEKFINSNPFEAEDDIEDEQVGDTGDLEGDFNDLDIGEEEFNYEKMMQEAEKYKSSLDEVNTKKTSQEADSKGEEAKTGTKKRAHRAKKKKAPQEEEK
mmetsp:Transcript_8754/g.9111  ORF Transcript_8754/g.9111 Transcript_8754/m.9111 type:complete len:179 (-) Transcript_8754:117-653(-)